MLEAPATLATVLSCLGKLPVDPETLRGNGLGKKGVSGSDF